jgi:hypothetical protein
MKGYENTTGVTTFTNVATVNTNPLPVRNG